MQIRHYFVSSIRCVVAVCVLRTFFVNIMVAINYFYPTKRISNLPWHKSNASRFVELFRLGSKFVAKQTFCPKLGGKLHSWIPQLSKNFKSKNRMHKIDHKYSWNHLPHSKQLNQHREKNMNQSFLFGGRERERKKECSPNKIAKL